MTTASIFLDRCNFLYDTKEILTGPVLDNSDVLLIFLPIFISGIFIPGPLSIVAAAG